MSPSIFIIDHDLDLVELITASFCQDDFTINISAQTEGCFIRVRDEKPDLVIIDMNSIESDCFELCKMIRTGTEVPILVLSANNSVMDSIKVLDFGADDFMQKPINPLVLVAHINNLLRRSRYIINQNFV